MRRQARIVSDNFIEIEKKFLISNIDASKLPDHRETIIEQTFLRSSEMNLDRRIRAEYCHGDVRYYLIEKYLTSRPAISFTRREEIGKRHFEKLGSFKDPERKSLRKRRWEFVWNDQQFRIDKYDGPLQGLMILEAVLRHENEDARIPGFCTVVREVTGENEYSRLPTEDSEVRSSGPAAGRKKAAAFHIVALVDLLGQGGKLGRFKGIPRTRNEKRTFTRLTRATFGTVEHFRERITILNQPLPMAHAVPDAVKEELHPSQLRLAERSAESAIGLQFFTDLALLKINLGGQRRHRPLIGLYGLLRQLGLLMLTELAEGVLFRGAIEAGICAELNGGDLYGQAISRAYALESDVAVYPRIVVGTHLLDYVRSFEEKRLSENERVVSDSYAGVIGKCLRQDTDGVLILSYLDPVLRKSYFGHENDFAYVVKSACRAIRRHRDVQRDEQLNERVARIEEYFRSQGCWAER